MPDSVMNPSEDDVSDKLILGECVETMRGLEGGIVKCIFADPPYNLQLGGGLRRPDESRVDGVVEDWDKFADFKAYDDFTRAWLTEARRILHRDGTIWVMGSYHNIFRVGAILQDLGFWILNDVVWRKSNPMPNFRGRRFTNAHETLIWAARDAGSRYCFNYQAMKALNDGVQMRSDWTFSICSGKERLRGADNKKLHPTQKPEALLHRILLASTQPGDLVLDPFSGTGTTAATAKKLGRRYVGIERDRTYFEGSRARLAKVRPLDLNECAPSLEKRALPRVPFVRFVENGVVPPGTKLFDRSRKVCATVEGDGTLVAGTRRGSIHKLGAYLTSAPSCNGWTFWHLETAGKFKPLDALRQEYHQGVVAEV